MDFVSAGKNTLLLLLTTARNIIAIIK